MKELLQLFNEMESFEKDIEKETYVDTTLARMAFQEYLNIQFSQIVFSDTTLLEN